MRRTARLTAAWLTLLVGCADTAPRLETGRSELGGQHEALQVSKSTSSTGSTTTPPFGTGSGTGSGVSGPGRPNVNPGRPVPTFPGQPGTPSTPGPQLPGTLPGTPLPSFPSTPNPGISAGGLPALGGKSPASFSTGAQCAAHAVDRLNTAGATGQAQRMGALMGAGVGAASALRPIGQLGWLRQKYRLDELTPPLKVRDTPPALEGLNVCSGGAEKRACYGLLARALTDNAQASFHTEASAMSQGLTEWSDFQNDLSAANDGKTSPLLPTAPTVAELENWAHDYPEAAQTLEPNVHLDSATQIVGAIDQLLAFGHFAEAAKLLVTLEKINPSAASAVKCLVGGMGGLSMLADRIKRGETVEPTFGRPARPTLNPEDNVGPLSGIVYAERGDHSKGMAIAAAPIVLFVAGAAIVLVLTTRAVQNIHDRHPQAWSLDRAVRSLGGGVNMGAGDEPPDPAWKDQTEKLRDNLVDCIANTALGQKCGNEVPKTPIGGQNGNDQGSGSASSGGTKPGDDGAGPNIDDPDAAGPKDAFDEDEIGFKPEDMAPIRPEHTDPETISSVQAARDAELRRRLMGFMMEASRVHVDNAQVDARINARSCGRAMLRTPHLQELWTRYTDDHYNAVVERMRPVDYTKPNWAERVRPSGVNGGPDCGVRDPVEPLP